MKIKENVLLRNFLMENEIMMGRTMFFLKSLKLIQYMDVGAVIVMDQTLAAECIIDNEEKLIDIRMINSEEDFAAQLQNGSIEIDMRMEELHAEFKHRYDMRKCEPVDVAEGIEMVLKHVKEESEEREGIISQSQKMPAHFLH